MRESTLFVRGQVWFWNDPVYSKKEDGITVVNGEAALRYSRYCIIAQTTSTIFNNNVLVIPCSSKNNTPHDVAIPILGNDGGYAKCRSLFPVNGKCLERYICTLSDDIMREIEAEIIKLLCPSITSTIDDDTIMNTFGINMNLNIHEETDQETEVNTNDTEEIHNEVKKKIRNKKWSDENIMSFIELYRNDKITAEEKFDLTPETARKYFNKWKDRLSNTVEDVNETEVKTEGVITSEDINKIIYSKHNIPKSISKIANIITRTLSRDILSSIPLAYEKDTYKLLKGEEFDAKINSIIYYTLSDFVNVRVYRDGNGKNFHIPNITENSPNMHTYHFIDAIWHNIEFRNIDYGDELMDIYRNKYGDRMGIDNEWLEKVKTKLENRLIIGEISVKKIINHLKMYTI